MTVHALSFDVIGLVMTLVGRMLVVSSQLPNIYYP